MKPLWDQLTEEFANSPTALIADVDCTDQKGGQSLCEAIGTDGYPTLKWGDPTLKDGKFQLVEYEGERDFDTLKAFAVENLGPVCGVENMYLCSENEKALISKYLALGPDTLDERILEQETAEQDVKDHFEAEYEKLKKIFKESEKKHIAVLKTIKDTEYKYMTAVRLSRDSEGSDYDADGYDRTAPTAASPPGLLERTLGSKFLRSKILGVDATLIGGFGGGLVVALLAWCVVGGGKQEAANGNHSTSAAKHATKENGRKQEVAKHDSKENDRKEVGKANESQPKKNGRNKKES